MLELIDVAIARNFHLDFTKLPMPRVMGLLRQLRVEEELMDAEMKNSNSGGKSPAMGMI